MTRSIDLGSGPDQPWGSALSAKAGGTAPPIPIITVRPLRLKMLGPCKICGERRFCCECEAGDD